MGRRIGFFEGLDQEHPLPQEGLEHQGIHVPLRPRLNDGGDPDFAGMLQFRQDPLGDGAHLLVWKPGRVVPGNEPAQLAVAPQSKDPAYWGSDPLREGNPELEQSQVHQQGSQERRKPAHSAPPSEAQARDQDGGRKHVARVWGDS